MLNICYNVIVRKVGVCDLKEKIFTLVLALIFLTVYITHTSVKNLSLLKLLFIPIIFFLAYLVDRKLGQDT